MLAISVVLLIVGLVFLTVWVLRDLSRKQWVRPALAVLLLSVVSLRLIVSFNPRRR